MLHLIMKYNNASKSSSIILLYLIFLVLHMFINPVNSYNCTEDFAINCGSSSKSISIVANRTWIGDTDPKHFSLLESQKNQSSITTVTPVSNSSLLNRVPYIMARISRHEFTYSFPVTSGLKFIRLHFRPASYLNFQRSKSLFSVKAGPYSLLKDFNASRQDPNEIVVKDYLRCIKVEPGQNLLNLTFTPNPNQEGTYAFINGIEVLSLFKHRVSCNNLNNSRRKLVGIIHEVNSTNRDSPPPQPPPPVSDHNHHREVTLYGVVPMCSLISVVAICLMCVWLRQIVRNKHNAKMERLYHLEATNSRSSKSVTLASTDLCRYFSILEIRAATINFDDIFVVGIGGFGKVYKGYIDDGSKPVAIKRFVPDSGASQGVQEFKNEVEMLSQLSHANLVRLIGYCHDEDDMIIVYDFMANGTLRDHLYGSSSSSPLSWKQRLEICIGAGRGLKYLHCGPKFKIIHRDVKTSNILLDEEWVAKVSDFGLSKIGPNGVSKFHVSTEVKGSLGYLDPEYMTTKRLTHKSDVYSFGVVLLEVLCGRPPQLRKVVGPERCLIRWARSCCKDGSQAVVDKMVDPFLKEKIVTECLSKFVETALSCVVHDGNQRPTMSDVVEGLEIALQLQLSAEKE